MLNGRYGNQKYLTKSFMNKRNIIRKNDSAYGEDALNYYDIEFPEGKLYHKEGAMQYPVRVFTSEDYKIDLEDVL